MQEVRSDPGAERGGISERALAGTRTSTPGTRARANLDTPSREHAHTCSDGAAGPVWIRIQRAGPGPCPAALGRPRVVGLQGRERRPPGPGADSLSRARGAGSALAACGPGGPSHTRAGMAVLAEAPEFACAGF